MYFDEQKVKNLNGMKSRSKTFGCQKYGCYVTLQKKHIYNTHVKKNYTIPEQRV